MRSIGLTLLIFSLGLKVSAYTGQAAPIRPVIDEFYPAEEAAERKTIVWPQVVRFQGASATVLEGGRPLRLVRAGEKCGEWDVVAILGPPEKLVVTERNFDHWGVLAYIGVEGVVATLRKAVGRLEQLPPPGRPFPPEYFDRLLSAQEDVLGRKVLGTNQEPSYDAVAGLLPPLDAYTFVGTVSSLRKPVILPDGRIGWRYRARAKEADEILFDPWKLAQNGMSQGATAKLASKKGLLGGYLPVVDFAFFDPDRRAGFEEIAFAVGDEPKVRVRLCTSSGQRTYWQATQSPLPADGETFYRDLLTAHRNWDQFFKKGMRLELPEPRVQDAARAGIARAMISYVGVQPKYGAGRYWATQHDAFPPTTLLFNAALLDWGFADEARDRLGYYLSRFVKEDGRFDYYGPAVSEYGQMLALAARLVRLTKDTAWLKTHRTHLERIGNRLLEERAVSRERSSPDAPSYGLLYGAAEADTRKEQNFYLSGNLWCWRGLADFGQLANDEGRRNGDGAEQELGKRWLAEAAAYGEDIFKALRHSRRTDAKPAFIPPIVGLDRIFSRMTEDELASYTNYRYWPEMLSAGLLPDQIRDEIIAYRTAHGGELLGMTRFEQQLDDWPYAHYAWALLDADRIDHYLLGFYSHLAQHQTRGTFNAYEQVPIRGTATRDYEADYCVPAQLVVPQLLRWMLVSETWSGQVLWLARTVPRRWFAEGFAVSAVPTYWGSVSLRVTPANNGVRAEIELPASHPGLTVHLRLRAPASKPFRQVKVEGTNQWRWEEEREVLHLSGDWIRVSILAQR